MTDFQDLIAMHRWRSDVAWEKSKHAKRQAAFVVMTLACGVSLYMHTDSNFFSFAWLGIAGLSTLWMRRADNKHKALVASFETTYRLGGYG